jgi:hypothetical protein
MARLLFDEPLSEALCDLTADLCPEAFMCARLPKEERRMWRFAGLLASVVASSSAKDGDFHRLALCEVRHRTSWRRGSSPAFGRPLVTHAASPV